MPQSTITIQSIVDHARTFSELAPILSISGYEKEPALTIANDTIVTMLSPGMNWKWNRMILPVFYTNPGQQDYGIPGVYNLQWLERSVMVDINNTALPKPKWPIEVVRDLPETAWQINRIGQVSWIYNNQLNTGTWTPNTTFVAFIGTPQSTQQPPPINVITDPNGNLWVVSNNATQNVTTGSVQPTWPSNPTYPTYSNPSTPTTTVNDGTVVWSALNPYGQGFRVNPLPAYGSLFYQIMMVGQKRPPTFTTLKNTIDPVPDDFASFFRQGFIANTYRHSPDPRIRDKHMAAKQEWLASMQQALTQSMREREEAGFYPSESLMNNGYPLYIGPANPFYPGGY